MPVASYSLVLGTLVAAAFLGAGFTLRGLLLSAIAIALIGPLAWRAIKRRLDLFEPIVLGNIALGVMFVARPVHQLLVDDVDHYGYSILPTFSEALFVALIGVVFFQLGYFLRPGASHWAKRLPAPPPMSPSRIAMAGLTYLIVGGLLFGTFLYQQGGIALLFILAEGRQQSNNDLLLGSTGYLYNGILMWGAAALMFFAIALVTRRRSYWFWCLLSTLSLIVFYGARGTRSALLPLMIAIPVYWYMWRSRRPRARMLIVSVILGVVLMGVLRDVRTVGEDSDFVEAMYTALRSPITEALDILGGADAEMFDSLASALLVVPEDTPFRYGATITDILVRAVPRPVWPSKPLESNDAIVDTLWPEHYVKSRASPAFSVIGPLYADSGIATVAIGMFFIGWVFAVSWRWLQFHHNAPVARLVYSMGLPFVIILLRGTIPDTLSRMLFLFVPIVLLVVLKRLRYRKRHGDGTRA